VRRFTLLTLIFLFVLLGIAAYFQFVAGQSDRRYCGPSVPACTPGVTATP
jgi:hypothetical protein